MIREYISELLLENDKKLNNLEQQLKNLMSDQDIAEKWLEALQSEANVDTNIFSPRVADAELKKKTEDAKEKINKAKQEIEYIKSFIETHLVKKQEYEKLLAEFNEISADKDQGRDKESNRELQVKDHLQESGKTIRISDFLSDLYRRTDFCLDILYNDRVKCKNELKSMKSAIRNFADSMKEEI